MTREDWLWAFARVGLLGPMVALFATGYAAQETGDARAVFTASLAAAIFVSCLLGIRRAGPVQSIAAGAWPPAAFAVAGVYRSMGVGSALEPAARLLESLGAPQDAKAPVFILLAFAASAAGWFIGAKLKPVKGMENVP